MAIINATTLRKSLFRYLREITQSDEKIIVTTKNGNVAIVSEEYLRALEETCYLYSIPGMRDSIIEGVNAPTENCETLEWRALLTK